MALELGTDWRVQVAHVMVDAVIVIGAFALLALHRLDPMIAIALVGPLVGARTAIRPRASSSSSSSPSSSTSSSSPTLPPESGGAIALVVGLGAMLARGWGRSKGIALLAFVALSIGGCASSLKVIKLAADQCVSVTDQAKPLGAEIIACVEDLIALQGEIAKRRAAAGKVP